MTRTHFRALADLCAETIWTVNTYIGYSEREAIIKHFIRLCEKSNRLFDEEVFRDAVKKHLAE